MDSAAGFLDDFGHLAGILHAASKDGLANVGLVRHQFLRIARRAVALRHVGDLAQRLLQHLALLGDQRGGAGGAALADFSSASRFLR